jgi:hypothetical protein
MTGGGSGSGSVGSGSGSGVGIGGSGTGVGGSSVMPLRFPSNGLRTHAGHPARLSGEGDPR